ncbi:hypothetical protein AB1207_18200 [Kineococcus endophyticus]|uniref:Uncharacterized protein n=1 Tax=Kineococcus endophyticus TaxID=1181883 RepID=A0ABV3PAQ8_9ACTN
MSRTAPTPQGPRRAVVVAVGGVTALGLAVAVALPIVVDGRRSSAAQDLHADLQRVATAQAAWKDEHGTYSTSLHDLAVPTARTDVAIVSAGADAFCAGAYDESTRTALFYSSDDSWSTHPCG